MNIFVQNVDSACREEKFKEKETIIDAFYHLSCLE